MTGATPCDNPLQFGLTAEDFEEKTLGNSGGRVRDVVAECGGGGGRGADAKRLNVVGDSCGCYICFPPQQC